MELRRGYKQSEAGIIPEHWEAARFEDFVSVRKEKVDPRKTSLTFPCVELEQIEQGTGKLMGVTETTPSSSTKAVFRKGDILFGKLRAYLRKYWFADWDGVCSTEIWPLVAKKDKAIGPYVFYLIQTKLFAEAASLVYGTHMPRTDWNVVRNVIFSLPPLSEQRAIAAALSDIDTLIASLDALIAKKRAIQQGAMRELLTGRRRLPGFSGEWEHCKLGEKVQIKKGQLITSKTIDYGNIPVIAGGKQPAYFHSAANRVGKTITISASGANAGYVSFYDMPIFASDCSTVSESLNYSIEFVYYFLLSIQEKIYQMQTGGAQPHIHPRDLSPIELVWPDTKEQRAIATVLSDMETDICVLEQRLDKTRQIKQGMMQELLSGRTRLV